MDEGLLGFLIVWAVFAVVTAPFLYPHVRRGLEDFWRIYTRAWKDALPKNERHRQTLRNIARLERSLQEPPAPEVVEGEGMRR